MSELKLHYGTQDALDYLTNELNTQLSVLSHARDSTKQAAGEQWAVIFHLLWLTEKMARSTALLGQASHVGACLITARSVLETAINIGFILAEGEQIAKRAQKHAAQKSYRDLVLYFRLKKNHLNETGPDLENAKTPLLQEAIDEFSTKKGQELPYWTPASLEDRIAVIGRKYGNTISDQFEICVSALFRRSSEVMHGTLYGAMYLLGRAPVAQKIASSDDLNR